MNNYFLAAETDIRKILKTYVGKAVNKEIAAQITKDIEDYIFLKQSISIELRKSPKGKHYIYPTNLYTLLVLKGIVLPYKLVEGKDTIQIDDRIFSFIDGKCSIKNI